MGRTIIENGESLEGVHAGGGARPSENGAPLRPQPALNRLIGRRGAAPFDALLWRLQARQPGAASRAATLGLVGCGEDAGVTTLAGNLAVRASELGLGPVLLIETDAERPRLRRAWKLLAGPGLEQLFAGEATYAQCLQSGPATGLHVIAATGHRRGSAAAWDAAAVDALLVEACGDHSLVLVDLPAASQLKQTVMLARRLDQVLLVVRAERTPGGEAERIAEHLREDGVPLAGAVLNRERSYVPRWLKRWI
jgi:Mrp family chromosome partitioning ATPase